MQNFRVYRRWRLYHLTFPSHLFLQHLTHPASHLCHLLSRQTEEVSLHTLILRSSNTRRTSAFTPQGKIQPRISRKIIVTTQPLLNHISTMEHKEIVDAIAYPPRLSPWLSNRSIRRYNPNRAAENVIAPPHPCARKFLKHHASNSKMSEMIRQRNIHRARDTRQRPCRPNSKSTTSLHTRISSPLSKLFPHMAPPSHTAPDPQNHIPAPRPDLERRSSAQKVKGWGYTFCQYLGGILAWEVLLFGQDEHEMNIVVWCHGGLEGG